MSGQLSGEGNLGKDPVLQYKSVRGEQRAVTKFSLRMDRPLFDENGDQRGDRGFWVSVSVWGKRGEMAAKLLRKGARIHVSGTLEEAVWNDKESDEERNMLQMTADYWAIDPICLETVQYAAKRGKPVRDEAMESEQEGVTV